MTKFEQGMLLLEQANATQNLMVKEMNLMQFLKEHSDEHWLHIDTIRKMIDEIYEGVDEWVFLTKELQRNMITSKLDYEAVYEDAYKTLQRTNKIKELCGIE